MNGDKFLEKLLLETSKSLQDWEFVFWGRSPTRGFKQPIKDVSGHGYASWGPTWSRGLWDILWHQTVCRWPHLQYNPPFEAYTWNFPTLLKFTRPDLENYDFPPIVNMENISSHTALFRTRQVKVKSLPWPLSPPQCLASWRSMRGKMSKSLFKGWMKFSSPGSTVFPGHWISNDLLKKLPQFYNSSKKITGFVYGETVWWFQIMKIPSLVPSGFELTQRTLIFGMTQHTFDDSICHENTVLLPCPKWAWAFGNVHTMVQTSSLCGRPWR